MKNKIKDALVTLAVYAFLLAPIVLGILWAVAVVDTCGWKGFFVECRIMTEAK